METDERSFFFIFSGLSPSVWISPEKDTRFIVGVMYSMKTAALSPALPVTSIVLVHTISPSDTDFIVKVVSSARMIAEDMMAANIIFSSGR